MQKVNGNDTVDSRAGVSLMRITDTLSYEAADRIRALYPQIRETKILVDLGHVKVTTSRGMTALLAMILDAAEQQRKLCLCNVSDACANIIDAMDLLSHVKSLRIFSTLEEGLTYLQE